jgi:hypothetical protein
MSRIQNTLVPRPADPSARRARRGGWLLIGAFVAFVVFVATIIAANGDHDRAAQAAADRLGVPLADLPAEVLAPINHQYANTPGLLLIFALVMLSFGLFIAGVAGLSRIGGPGRRSLATPAVVLAAIAPLCWLGIMALEAGTSVESPDRWVLDWYDAVYNPLIAASSVAASLALICLAVILRQAGQARRTGVVVIALSLVTVVGAVVVGVPPIVPLLVGVVLGIVMIRSTRTTAVA